MLIIRLGSAIITPRRLLVVVVRCVYFPNSVALLGLLHEQYCLVGVAHLVGMNVHVLLHVSIFKFFSPAPELV